MNRFCESRNVYYSWNWGQDQSTLVYTPSESLMDTHPRCAGEEQKRSWRLSNCPIWARCQIPTEGWALQMHSFPISFWSAGVRWSNLLNPGALRARSGGEEDGHIHCWSLGRRTPQPTAWGLPKETDAVQLWKQIPSHLSHFYQTTNLAISTSSSLRQERHQQT